jgi:gamma-glutamyltranspeptidase/glutathione hydrolase
VRLRLAVVLALLAGLLAWPAAVSAQSEPVKEPVAVGTGGAVASVDALASQAAIDVLRRGGNAVDAAVAAAAVLGVTEPYSCGIGGGGFFVIRASDGSVATIDGREKAPAAMRPDSFMENGAPLAFNDARWSGLSVGVPGTVRGWNVALGRYGTMSLAELLGPAITIARDGFEVDQTFFDQTQGNVDFFDDITSTQAVYLEEDGTPYDVGETFRNPDMARAYARIVRLGPKGFYRGNVADAMVTAVQSPPLTADANHVWRPGSMTMRDVRGYIAPERAPTLVRYRGLNVYGMGPPSSGGSTVGEALNILEGYDLAGMTRTQALHRYLEASTLSFADRGQYLGDPDYVDVPLAGLLSDSFAAERRALIGDTAAAKPVPPGDPTDNEGPSTTHLTVADRFGNVVAYTFTIESIGGSGITVPGYGFLLNNELTDFNFVPGTANSPDGGKRPRSSMSPTIVTDDGEPLVAVGSPGGSMIITSVSEIGAATGIAFLPSGFLQAVAEPVRRGGGSAMVAAPAP